MDNRTFLAYISFLCFFLALMLMGYVDLVRATDLISAFVSTCWFICGFLCAVYFGRELTRELRYRRRRRRANSWRPNVWR